MAKNVAPKAQTQTTTTVVGINISKMVMDNLRSARESIESITVDLALLDVDTMVASLAENIIIIADDVNNHLSTVVKGKKISTADAKRQLGDITVDLLLKLLDETITLIEGTEQFGNTTLSVKSLKGIRVASEKIKDDAADLMIENKIYKVRNPS